MSSEIVVIAPQNIEESEKLSLTLSKSNLLPEALRGKPGDVLATLLTGAELGLAPMQSLRAIQIIKGKPTLSAELMGALVKRRKEVCEYLQLVSSTPLKAVYRTKRAGDPEPTTMEFAMEDATRAGLNGDNWRKYPAAMLRARCLSALCKAVYPDICLGLYDSDSGELDGGSPPPNTPPPPPERELNPAPTSAPVQSKTEAVKAQLAKKGAIIDVKAGESEAQAEARAGAVAAQAMQEISALREKYGLRADQMPAFIKSATGKTERGQLVMEDVAKVESAIEDVIDALATAGERTPEASPTP